jgi:hypothetical protein
MSGFDNLSETTRTTAVTGPVLLSDYDVLVLGATGAVILSLPAVASIAPGRTFRIYKDAAAFTVTITPASGLIDGAASKVLAASAVHACIIVTDGTNWYSTASY